MNLKDQHCGEEHTLNGKPTRSKQWRQTLQPMKHHQETYSRDFHILDTPVGYIMDVQ